MATVSYDPPATVGGPVEACSSPTGSAPASAIRRPRSAAPLKPRRRGPSPCTARRTIRRPRSAAPLKRPHQRTPQPAFVHDPPATVGGPVEARVLDGAL